MMAAEDQLLVGEDRVDVVLRGRGPLEFEEDQLGRDGGRSLFDALHGRRDLVIEHVDAEAQSRVRTGAPDELVQSGHVAHERRQRAGIERRDLTTTLCEGIGQNIGSIDECVDTGLVVEEGLEVPRDRRGGEVVAVRIRN